MGILWTILIGFVAGVLAKLITPGDNEPSGFYPDYDSGHCGRIRGHLFRTGSRLVSGRRRCWPHWRDGRGDHCRADLGCHCRAPENHASFSPSQVEQIWHPSMTSSSLVAGRQVLAGL